MAIIKQYRPAFFEGFVNETKEFSSVKELLEIDFVKQFSDEKNFHQYSMSDNHLMAEYDKGYEWWVIGFIDSLDSVKDLPTWKPKYKKSLKK